MNYFEKINAKHIPSVDLVKFIMAIFVVAIHTLQPFIATLPIVWSKILNFLIGLAVPFFFVTSGFLLCEKLKVKDYSEKLLYMRKWLKRTLRLYIIWTIIYLPYAILGFYKDNIGLLKSVLVYIRNVVFVGENYLSWPLWYLLAMIVAGLIYYAILLIRPKRFLLVLVTLAILLWGIGIIIDSNEMQFELYFSLFRRIENGFFKGFPFMTIGFIISIIGRCLMWLSSSLLFLGIILQSFEVNIGGLIITYAFFSMVLSLRIHLENEEICKMFRLSSVVIYFVHMLWIGILIICFEISSLYLFIISLLLSLMTSYLVIRNKNEKVVKLLFK